MEKVVSNRIIYTPSQFAKDSLYYLQEVGQSKTLSKNTNSRKKLDSYLFFIVLEGEGTLSYKEKHYKLKKDNCVFIDCNYSHSHTSSNWKISWVHINGTTIRDIYKKYCDRNGENVFNTRNGEKYNTLINNIHSLASSDKYIKDMEINSEIASLLSLIMSETVYYESNRNRKYNLDEVKQYLDDNYVSEISLDLLSSIFFINKFYLTRAFKEKCGTTINNYIFEKRINKAKELIRYGNSTIMEISKECGFQDQNYFSRVFKKIEGTTPLEYRKMW